MRKLIVVAIAAAALSATAAPQSHRAPGLWEVTVSTHFTQGGIQIPPEARRQMEARGIKMPDMGAPHTFKHCLTPEEAAKDEHPDFGGKSCKTTQWNWSGDRFHAEFTCNSNGQDMRGRVDGTMSPGGKGFEGTVHMEGDDPHMGGHFVMEGQSSGKWLGPSCGNTR
ncbi:MAG TPA: DUF3617 domain-containing protein [Rhodanobacteraceae bacterium]|nr:DUF3617 domain-containing protein [Rhodanobacteraceae bacterium]